MAPIPLLKCIENAVAHLNQGPGTELKRILESLGIEPGNCRCNSMVKKMNRWGSAGCHAHLREIVDHLEFQARARGWKLPAMRFGAAALVRLAIWKSLWHPLSP